MRNEERLYIYILKEKKKGEKKFFLISSENPQQQKKEPKFCTTTMFDTDSLLWSILVNGFIQQFNIFVYI